MTNQDYPSQSFLRNLKLFSHSTQQKIDEILTLTLQLLFLKYKRKQEEYQTTLEIRKRKGKRINPGIVLLLKDIDISRAFTLIDFHLRNMKVFDVESNKDLAKNFGSLPLDEAVKYYDYFLKGGDIKDAMGRKIVFQEDGKSFLYKEHTEEGRHVPLPENYSETRGKRLQWIDPVLKNTREIYRQEEKAWITYLYVGIFKIKIEQNTPFEKEQLNHFLVVTRQEKGKPIRFVTAYYMDMRKDLLKHLESARPLSIEEQDFIRRSIEKGLTT